MIDRLVFTWVMAALMLLMVGCGKPEATPPPATTQTPADSPAEPATPASAAVPAPVPPAPLVAATRVTWTDPAGDVEAFAGKPQPDITQVTAVGENGQIVITFTIVGGPAAVLDHLQDGKRSADTLGEIWIDTDNDTGTGRGPSRSEGANRPLTGYEVKVSVMLGYRIRMKDSGMETAMHGNVGIDDELMEVLGHSASAMLWWQVGEQPESSFDSFKSEAYSEMTDTGIVLRFPCDAFGVKPGDTIRLCFNEDNQDAFGTAGFSEDRLLKLQ